MRILHLSDAHIDFSYSRIRKIDPETGLGIRSADAFLSFEQALRLAEEYDVDVILDTGDTTDNYNPSNKSRAKLQEIYNKINRPMAVIAGNHNFPASRSQGFAVDIFNNIPKDFRHVAYRGEYELIEIGDLAIHAVPWCFNNDIFNEEIKKAVPNKKFKYNILALHCSIGDIISDKQIGPFGQKTMFSVINRGFDYIGIGHWHGQVEIGPMCWYAGSLERFGWDEAKNTPGVLLVDLDQRTVTPIPLTVRPMIDLPQIDCLSLSGDEVSKKIRESVSNVDIDGAMVRQRLANIDSSGMLSIDQAMLRDFEKRALLFDLKWETVAQESEERAVDYGMSVKFTTLEEDFASTCQDEDLKKIGLAYIETASSNQSQEGDIN